MNDSGSIVEFFYNIVPGTLFILIIQYYYKISFLPGLPIAINDNNSAIVIFIDLLLGLFLGFVFQGLTKIAREKLNLNEIIAEEVIENEKFNKSNYKELKNKTPKQVIYYMDNYLRCDEAAFLPSHFSARFAFWSNVFWAILLLIPINFLHYCYFDNSEIWLFLAIFFSAWMSKKYMYAFYDVILVSYAIKVSKNNSK